jgi:hypothetical protein
MIPNNIQKVKYQDVKFPDAHIRTEGGNMKNILEKVN